MEFPAQAEGGESHHCSISSGYSRILPQVRQARVTRGVPIGSPKGVPVPTPELCSTSTDSLFSASVLSGTIFSDTVARLRAAGCVFAEDEAHLLLDAAADAAELLEFLERRVAGYPLEHIIGWAQFSGLRITVDPGVFVPRRRTELVVDEAAALLRGNPGGHGSFPRVVVDLCCGSGAVGAALARRVGGIELHAADIDPIAVKCARRNVGKAGGQVYEGDLYEPLPPRLLGKVGLLAVNAPYVPTEAISMMPHEAREHESRIALDGGADGLAFHRRIAAGAPNWLAPGGHLLIETSERQAAGTASIMAAAGFSTRIIHSDELDGTVVIGLRAQDI
jgi:release factor glutamine methyltransferase